MSDQGMLRSLMDLQDRTERIETVDLPLPELTPPFHRLCALRGFWPMSAFSAAGAAFDQSGNGRTLTRFGDPIYDYDALVPYIRFDGTGDYLLRADEAGLDITGAEAYVGTPGLTLGGWFRPEDITNGNVLFSKWAAGGNLSYMLGLAGDVAGDPAMFFISDDGTNFDAVYSTSAYVTNIWQWVVGRFNDADAGAELAVWRDDEMTTAATARNAIFSGAADFNIGGFNNGSFLYTGRASMCFLCAAALPDQVVNHAFQATRGLYGV